MKNGSLWLEFLEPMPCGLNLIGTGPCYFCAANARMVRILRICDFCRINKLRDPVAFNPDPRFQTDLLLTQFTRSCSTRIVGPVRDSLLNRHF